MNNEVIVTCAVTGAGDTLGKHPEVPVTPEQISNAAIAAAKAGASVAHIHVRDPETGLGSRDVNLFKEVVERIRDSETDIVINLTAGMGGDWVPSEENPLVASKKILEFIRVGITSAQWAKKRILAGVLSCSFLSPELLGLWCQ